MTVDGQNQAVLPCCQSKYNRLTFNSPAEAGCRFRRLIRAISAVTAGRFRASSLSVAVCIVRPVDGCARVSTGQQRHDFAAGEQAGVVSLRYTGSKVLQCPGDQVLLVVPPQMAVISAVNLIQINV
jgi:hypothetical protein